MLPINELFQDGHSLAYQWINELEYPWEAIPLIRAWILSLSEGLDKTEYTDMGDGVYIHKTCKIYPTSTILGPTIVGEGTEVRPGAFIRGNALIGRNCVIGNSTEIKNAVLFDNVQVPHYNYIGDSLLGYKAHFGAGSLTSNVKGDKTEIAVKNGKIIHKTGLKKFGAIVGDEVEIGCQTVLNPGTVIGAGTRVYPLLSIRGVILGGMIVKALDNIVPIVRGGGKKPS